MKLPRGVSADRLIRALERLGYEVIRQPGSHVRVRHPGPPAHSITVPMHHPVKTGTLHGILAEIARPVSNARVHRGTSLTKRRRVRTLIAVAGAASEEVNC